MKLTDLHPQWVHPTIFIFECPCGCKGTPRAVWISCKSEPMPVEEQWTIFRAAAERLGLHSPAIIVQTRGDTVWSISSSDFWTMSVSPSLDYSAAKHWHGFITNGAIT